MAVPRVFLSSTYYDLKQIRNDLCKFIEGIGYQVVMHERSDVAYSHEQALENDCYDELALCDIVVCVIGNFFGSQSKSNDFSITMNELDRALNNRKLVYVYVAKDVLYENRTYRENRNIPNFRPVAVNDVRIHEYISKLNDRVGTKQPIQAFENVDEIISSLKSQFAGLFQSLLARRVAASESGKIYELHEEIEALKNIVAESKESNDAFWNRFAGTVLARNPAIIKIETCFNLSKCHLLIKDIWAVDELATQMGCDICAEDGTEFQVEEGASLPVCGRRYSSVFSGGVKIITISFDVFNADGSIRILNRQKSEELIKSEITESASSMDMPF